MHTWPSNSSSVADPHRLINRALAGLDVRGIGMPGSNGPMMDCPWRLNVRQVGAQPLLDRIETTPWVFGSAEAVDQRLQVRQAITGRAHWAQRRLPAMNLGRAAPPQPPQPGSARMGFS
jgi:hypothetical protein